MKTAVKIHFNVYLNYKRRQQHAEYDKNSPKKILKLLVHLYKPHSQLLKLKLLSSYVVLIQSLEILMYTMLLYCLFRSHELS